MAYDLPPLPIPDETATQAFHEIAALVFTPTDIQDSLTLYSEFSNRDLETLDSIIQVLQRIPHRYHRVTEDV
jgi:hypothetical protein